MPIQTAFAPVGMLSKLGLGSMGKSAAGGASKIASEQSWGPGEVTTKSGDVGKNVFGEQVASSLADTSISRVFGDDGGGSDRLAKEKAKTELWKRKMAQKYQGPRSAMANTLMQNQLAGAIPIVGPALQAANTTKFLLKDVLPYIQKQFKG
jgi:hypothetical protein